MFEIELFLSGEALALAAVGRSLASPNFVLVQRATGKLPASEDLGKMPTDHLGA